MKTLYALVPLVLAAAQAGAQQPAWDNFSDTWVATDALGRKVGYHRDPRPDRTVGIFYFLWHGAHVEGGPWDVTRILANDPAAMEKNSSPPWGPMHAPHHWGESLFGYYLGDDEWVLRRHAQLLADAGVDMLIFDTSNKLTYRQYYLALFQAFQAERRAGNRTPYVAFLTPFGDPRSTVRELWEQLYSKRLHEDLWFRWEGKPLILADPAKVDADLRRFFTFRKPQPSYFEGPTGPNMWSWLEVFPQHVFRNDRGEAEQMSVGTAQNAVDGKVGIMSHPRALGRSYHHGRWEKGPGAILHGHNATEQWERALEQDPRFIFVTGWNEWFAGRFDQFLNFKAPVVFVDQFDHEHSRDIEPMKGGHGDNYYYQMAAAIRRYKGSRQPPAAGEEKSIDLAAGFEQWKDVTPEFRDEVADTYHRDHPGFNTVSRYVNVTGRNDLAAMKVASDGANLYFYARVADALSNHSDPHWMVLFIDADRDRRTGWQGYDYVLNRRVKDGRTSFLEHTRSGWRWQPKAEVRYTVRGREFMAAVPRQALALPAGSFEIEFKWADNFQREDSIDEFLLNGDAAPPGRFNYLYLAR